MLTGLKARIAEGAFVPGTFLPSERQLAEEMGVARNTIRGALSLLEQEGVVSREEGRGTIVREPMGSGVSGAVLLILPQPETEGPSPLSPEAMALLGSALCACGGSDIRFHLLSMPADGAKGLTRLARAYRAAGVLLVECRQPEVLDLLQDAKVPHVVINQEYDLPGPATRVDFWRVGRKAAEYLLALGHRRLGVLSGPADRYLYERMLAGFRGRCAESELYLDAGNVARVKSCSETAREAALDMLGRPDRPTAMFCTRDVRAYGAYLAARELGLRVPEDLSLVGYDDITWPGEGRQFLTTFPEPTRELGGAAIHMLTTWIRTGAPPADVVLCPEIIVRKSAAPCSEQEKEVSQQ